MLSSHILTSSGSSENPFLRECNTDTIETEGEQSIEPAPKENADKWERNRRKSKVSLGKGGVRTISLSVDFLEQNPG